MITKRMKNKKDIDVIGLYREFEKTVIEGIKNV